MSEPGFLGLQDCRIFDSLKVSMLPPPKFFREVLSRLEDRLATFNMKKGMLFLL
jgi:hypothetical protein